MFEHKFGQTFQAGSDKAFGVTEVVKVDSQEGVKRVIPGGGTTQFDVTVVVANMRSLCIGISKGTATVKTNSSSTPAQTLAIKAANPLMWSKNDNPTNPLTTNLTSLHVTNNGDEDAEFLFIVGVDSTPSAEG